MLFLSITSSDKAQVAWWAADRPDVRLRVVESPGASNLTIQATSSVHNINNFIVKTLLNYTFFKRSWHH